MNKSNKILLGILTIWPILYILFFMFFVFSSMVFTISESDPSIFMGGFAFVFLFHFITIVLALGLTVFYAINIFRNDRVESDKKPLWLIIIFVGNVIGMIIYFYLFIWKDEENKPEITDSNN